MQEHTFTVGATFSTVADALAQLGGFTVLENDELHVLAVMDETGAAVLARPTFPDSVEMIVAEDFGAETARACGELFARLLDCSVTPPTPVSASEAL